MKRIRVLIVDDDKDFAESMAMALEGHGYKVELVHTGVEAIKKFLEQNFDIIFMDVKLPGMNGVESFMEIRKVSPDAKVVMMTGYSVERLLDRAVENGAWGVLYKPLDMKKVLDMLEIIEPFGILIADDDPDFVESIRGILEGKGKTVFVATNGREAVERILSNGIDILILDLRMPVLNGLEAYIELKRMGRAVPTIIVTAFADEEAGTIKVLRSMSVNRVLRKPFDSKELLETIEGLLRSKKRQRP